MAPARKLNATDTTGWSWCSTTASCNPLGSVVSLNGGKRTGASGVGFGGRDGNESWADRQTAGLADRRTTAANVAAVALSVRPTACPRDRRLIARFLRSPASP